MAYKKFVATHFCTTFVLYIIRFLEKQKTLSYKTHVRRYRGGVLQRKKRVTRPRRCGRRTVQSGYAISGDGGRALSGLNTVTETALLFRGAQ